MKADVKECSVMKRDAKYDLREAKEEFNLWDNVHGRDAIKHLEQFSKWEPGKKERERREKLEMIAMMEAQQKKEDEELEGKNTDLERVIYFNF